MEGGKEGGCYMRYIDLGRHDSTLDKASRASIN
jgi:hypothetical protein